MKRTAALAALLLLLSVQPLSGQSPYSSSVKPAVAPVPLPINRGSTALWQSLKKLHTRASLIMITAHPDDEDGDTVAMGDGVAQPARDGQPDKDLQNGHDQHGRMLMDGDDLAFVGQKVPIYRGRHRISVRNQPHDSTQTLNRCEEGGKPVSRRGQEGADVVHDVSGGGGLHYHKPH